MAALTIDTATIGMSGKTAYYSGIAGGTVTPGAVIAKYTDDKWYVGNQSDLTGYSDFGIALTRATINQQVLIQKTGTIALGAANATPGQVYAIGTAGGIDPIDDIDLGGELWVKIIGVAPTASTLQLNFSVPAVFIVPE